MKLTRFEQRVYEVIEPDWIRSLLICRSLEPVSFNGVHLVLNDLVKYGLIESKVEGDKRYVRRTRT